MKLVSANFRTGYSIDYRECYMAKIKTLKVQFCKKAFHSSDCYNKAKITFYDTPINNSHKIYLRLVNIDDIIYTGTEVYWSRNKRKVIYTLYTGAQNLFKQLITFDNELVVLWYTVKKIK